MGKYRRIGFIFLGILFSCTNVGLNQLNDRVADNFSGTIVAPADLDPPGTDNFSFMAIGDTHIGSPQGEVLNRYAAIALTTGDAFVIVAGDVTHGGGEGEFIQFKQVMSDNSMGWRVAIGNHDIYFDGWSRYRNQIGRSIYSFNADNTHFVMLDSANGVLGKTQLEWLENDLKANTRPNIILVSHFPPWNGTFSSLYRMSSEEEAALLKDIAYRYGVDLVISGHYHGYEEAQLGTTKYIVTGGANAQTDIGQRQNYVRVSISGTNITTQVIYP